MGAGTKVSTNSPSAITAISLRLGLNSGHGATGGCHHPVTPKITAQSSQPRHTTDNTANIITIVRVTHLCARGATA